MPNGKQVWIDYTNYRGERGWRRIEPGLLDFTSTEFHPEPQWLMEAWDPEKMAWRTFAMKDVHAWSLTPPAGVHASPALERQRRLVATLPQTREQAARLTPCAAVTCYGTEPVHCGHCGQTVMPGIKCAYGVPASRSEPTPPRGNDGGEHAD